MLRFPPVSPDPKDATFLIAKGEVFAKIKTETKAVKRNVFLTEHTLVFVNKGAKYLHFPDGTITVSKDNIVLLKKGIYTMAEYMEDGLNFEALMLFISNKVIQSLPYKEAADINRNVTDRPFLIFPASELLQNFRDQVKQYFGRSFFEPEAFFANKQKEILLLLMASGHQATVNSFVHSILSNEPEDLDYTMQAYLLKPVTIPELANLSNRSLAAFKRDFQRRYQCPPRQWINRQRLAHAQLLLLNTTKRASEVATECGFENTSYFIRIFRMQYGYTPMSLKSKTAII
jgi:AraC family transcriptional regulator, exoenzyme S synthesis regulatory protein ExsA